MSKVRFVLNRAGVRELLKSEEMVTVIQEYASAVQNRAGDGYTADTQVHNRAVGIVRAETHMAIRDNKKNNTLLKALHG